MRHARPALVGLALVASLAGPQLSTARDKAGVDFGANPICFSAAHEQPNNPDHPGGVRFGPRLQTYLDDCRGEMFLPDPVLP